MLFCSALQSLKKGNEITLAYSYPLSERKRVPTGTLMGAVLGNKGYVPIVTQGHGRELGPKGTTEEA